MRTLGSAPAASRKAPGEIFRGGLGLCSALIIDGIAIQATQMPVSALRPNLWRSAMR